MNAIEKLTRAGWTITIPDIVGEERPSIYADNGDANRGVFYEPGKLDAALEILAEKCELAPPTKPTARDPDPLRVAGDPVESEDQGEAKADDAGSVANRDPGFAVVIGKDAAAEVVAKSAPKSKGQSTK